MPGASKRGRGGKATTSSRPVKIRKLKEVVFDEDARKEYLTGFSKRKKARELNARSKAIDRDREEKNESRRALRDERKERAALNVRNAQELYGDADAPLNSSSDSDSDDEDEASKGPTAAYESNDLITTVHVEAFTLSRSSSPVNYIAPNAEGGNNGEEEGEKEYDNHEGESDEEKEKKKAMKSTRASGVESAKKRVRNKPQYRPKMTSADKKERAKGGKAKKAGFLKGNSGTKGKGNKRKP